MTRTQADLDLADLHVAQAERHVTKQHLIVQRLADDGHSTDMAVSLLQEFEQTLRDHRTHRDVIAEELRIETRRREEHARGA
jgi:hypothetical protein